ncbi:MAG: GTP-binding protein [Limnohabitans sp.]|nr:GTP-binding protein [Limnohabitans sp.]
MAHAPWPARIPLTVIGGFLGAGKTSVLVHWLQQTQGQRIAVLVNDFGTINIDAELLGESNSDTIALSNGCVCCQIGGDLSQALLQVLDNPQPFDAIVIEASGVSDPWPIAQIALADKRLSLHGVLVVVDAAAVRTHAADPLLHDSLLRQLRAADLLVLNKTDLCSADEIWACTTWLHDTVGPVPCLPCQHGQLPLALLQTDWEPQALASTHVCTEQCAHEHGTAHSHAHSHSADHGNLFTSDSRSPERVFHTAWLREQLQQTPAWVMRLKGWVRTHEHGWSEIQFAGRHASVQRARHTPTQARVLTIALRTPQQTQAMPSWMDAVWGST